MNQQILKYFRDIKMMYDKNPEILQDYFERAGYFVQDSAFIRINLNL